MEPWGTPYVMCPGDEKSENVNRKYCVFQVSGKLIYSSSLNGTKGKAHEKIHNAVLLKNKKGIFFKYKELSKGLNN